MIVQLFHFGLAFGLRVIRCSREVFNTQVAAYAAFGSKGWTEKLRPTFGSKETWDAKGADSVFGNGVRHVCRWYFWCRGSPCKSRITVCDNENMLVSLCCFPYWSGDIHGIEVPRFCSGEELKMSVMFKPSSLFRATNALRDRFMIVMSHMWPEKLASKRIVHSTLTWMSGNGWMECQIKVMLVQWGGYHNLCGVVDGWFTY